MSSKELESRRQKSKRVIVRRMKDELGLPRNHYTLTSKSGAARLFDFNFKIKLHAGIRVKQPDEVPEVCKSLCTELDAGISFS